MPSGETFVHELEEKNANSFQRLVAVFAEAVRKEDFTPTEAVRLEMRAAVESIEVAALWLTEGDELPFKIELAAQCGDGARHYELLEERLAALGVEPTTFDARFGGYSKLFAFFRSLQTTEERAAGGLLTLRNMNARRLEILASQCEAKGDPETARLFREVLAPAEQGHATRGRQRLMNSADSEESQARGRRAAFRTIEVLSELYEPSLLRKFLSRSIKK